MPHRNIPHQKPTHMEQLNNSHSQFDLEEI